ncbi:uncharacterized protein LOC110465324 [Mizuhopecten yessoensis]|uniref:uncharacterized protein LOC110465324 n=1 Tax=Mizuhopecten yessoensis TaxID=6573 RepID=UPI000B45BDBB|nr:uncharacterized protein LOC110465324 [Mizuhopecten yessoensis]
MPKVRAWYIVMMLLVVCFEVLFFSANVASQDPCDTNHPLVPDLSSRGPSEQDTKENDNHLTEKYYSAGNKFDMAMSMEAGKFACGSTTQCWMNDNIPTVEEGEKDTRICCSSLFESGNSCFETFTIKVTNCGDYRLYFLLGLGSRASSGRYCFAIQSTSNDPAPDFIPSNVQIVPQLIRIEQKTTTSAFYIHILKFVCIFTEKSGLFYTVFFYVNGNFISDHIKTVGDTTEAFLLESELPSDANTMGITIFCEVGAMSTMDGQVGALRKSPEFFAGLKVGFDLQYITLAQSRQ